MTNPATAVRAVFGTTELLEAVLSQTSNTNVARLRRVNHRWQEVIAGSDRLQKLLFIRADNRRDGVVWVKRKWGTYDPYAPSEHQYQPVLQVGPDTPSGLWPQQILKLHPLLNDIDEITCGPSRRLEFALPSLELLRYANSSRQGLSTMLITQPPAVAMRVKAKLRIDEGCSRDYSIPIENATGITFRDLEHTVRAALDQFNRSNSRSQREYADDDSEDEGVLDCWHAYICPKAQQAKMEASVALRWRDAEAVLNDESVSVEHMRGLIQETIPESSDYAAEAYGLLEYDE